MKISSEQPIKNKKEDRLNRSVFATSIADVIKNYEDKEGLTIGINGEWGAGKTSIIEMIKENLKEDSNYIIMDFDPWLFSTRKQLIIDFFKELSILIGEDQREERKKLGEDLMKYADLLDVVSLIPPLSFLKLLKTPAKAAGKALVGKEENLKKVKNRINKSLLNFSEKILIVIDDIDRLDEKEIKEIFQLIRAVGNFSNVVYLLSYHEKNIKKVYNEEDYLEKIINVPINIPKISKRILNKFFLDEIQNMYKEKAKFDNDYWDKIYPLIFKDNFKNLRVLKRFLNYLKFMSGPIIQDIDLIDYLIVNFFQYFEINIYNFIKNNEKRLTDYSQSKYCIKNFGDENKIKKEYIESLNLIFIQRKINKYNRCIRQAKYFKSYFEYVLGDSVFSNKEITYYLEINSCTELLTVNKEMTKKIINNFQEIYFRLTEKNVYEYIKFIVLKIPDLEKVNFMENEHAEGFKILKNLIIKSKKKEKVLEILQTTDFTNKYEIQEVLEMFHLLYKNLNLKSEKEIIREIIEKIIYKFEFSKKIFNSFLILKEMDFNLEIYIKNITEKDEDVINYLKTLESVIAIHNIAEYDDEGNQIGQEEEEETAIFSENINDYLTEKVKMLNQ